LTSGADSVPYVVISKVELKYNEKKNLPGAQDATRLKPHLWFVVVVWCEVATARVRDSSQAPFIVGVGVVV
jgi:hypothetical protein